MSEGKPEIQKPELRVIELNEWFTPFENFHDIPTSEKSENEEYKEVEFEVPHLGRFRIDTEWDLNFYQELETKPEGEYLLVLPASEKVISTQEVKREQEKIETRILIFDGPYSLNYDKRVLSGLKNKLEHLPYSVELELPSGQILTAPLLLIYEMIGIEEEGWDLNGKKIYHQILVPEAENILNKIRLRIIPTS